MSEQPEALRLAYVLKQAYASSQHLTVLDAAAELRRQHERIKELEATIATLNSALALTSAGNKKLEAALAQCREAVVQELVAGSGEPQLYEGITVNTKGKYQSTEDGYTSDQLAGAILRERERCAKAVEAEAHMFETLAAAKSCVAAIRSGE